MWTVPAQNVPKLKARRKTSKYDASMRVKYGSANYCGQNVQTSKRRDVGAASTHARIAFTDKLSAIDRKERAKQRHTSTAVQIRDSCLYVEYGNLRGVVGYKQ